MAPRQRFPESSDDLRERIVVAAAQELDEKGYTGTSIGSIALRAGVSKSNVQARFPTKASIALTIVRAAFEGGAFLVPPGLPQRGLAALAAANRYVAATFASSVSARAAMRLIDEAPELGEPMPKPFVAWVERACVFIRESIDDGDLPQPDSVEDAAWGLVIGSAGATYTAHVLRDFETLEARSMRIFRAQLVALGAHDVDKLIRLS